MAQHIIIHGFGIEGKAALPYFQDKFKSSHFTVIDRETHDIIGVQSFNESDGLTYLKTLETEDILFIRSPGVPPTNPIIEYLDHHNINHETALSYWLSHDAPSKIITVSGSKGKSTTTALISYLLAQNGEDAFMAGNVGITPFDKEFGNDAIAVIEASSFQLFDCNYKSDLLVITSIYDTHTDWHGTMEAYCEAKLRPLLMNNDCKSLVSNLIQPFVKIPDTAHNTWLEDELNNLELPETIPNGFKNNPLALNLKTALLAIKISGFTDFNKLMSNIDVYLESWTGLDHRMEVISKAGGRIWVDDSLATIPEASILALQQFPDKVIHLLLGGKFRGQSYESFFEYVGNNKNIHIHASGPAVGAMHPLEGQNFYEYDNFEHAVEGAYNKSKADELILFSPGAPSEPPYLYYHVRARLLKEFASKLEG